MATAPNDMPKRKRVRYSVEYRADALALAERVDIAAAVIELGVQATQMSCGHERLANNLPAATHSASMQSCEI